MNKLIIATLAASSLFNFANSSDSRERRAHRGEEGIGRDGEIRTPDLLTPSQAR